MAYMNVAEIETAIEALAGAYPSSCQRIELPHLSHDGRRISALRLGTQPVRPAALFIGGLHARELVPPDLLVALSADLLEAQMRGTGLRYGGRYFPPADIARLFDNLAIYVLPCANPDGRHFVQTSDPMWRKNRNPAHGSGSSSCCGADLNRNFPFLWDHTVKFAADSHVATSADPCDPQVYRGDGPASEPETRNVIRLLDDHSEIRWMIDIHSHVPAVFHVWGSDEPQTTDPGMSFKNPAFDGARGRPGDTAYREFIPETDLASVKAIATTVAKAVRDVRGEEYAVSPSFELYPTSGASDDYAYSRHMMDASKPKVLGFTIECGRETFQPAWPEAENIIRDMSAGLIVFLLLVPDAKRASFATS
jgi:murein tripeptide amidase MpaA